MNIRFTRCNERRQRRMSLFSRDRFLGRTELPDPETLSRERTVSPRLIRPWKIWPHVSASGKRTIDRTREGEIVPSRSFALGSIRSKNTRGEGPRERQRDTRGVVDITISAVVIIINNPTARVTDDDGWSSLIPEYSPVGTYQREMSRSITACVRPPHGCVNARTRMWAMSARGKSRAADRRGRKKRRRSRSLHRVAPRNEAERYTCTS